MKFTVTQENVGEDSSTVFVAVGHNGFRVVAETGFSKDDAREQLRQRTTDGAATATVFRITMETGKEQK